MRGAGIALALAKYLACPAYLPNKEWTSGAYLECEDCPLQAYLESLEEGPSICETLRQIDEAMEVIDESEFA